ncbi:MAG: alpha/beta fold hydrolase [Myxococcota bacterium]
MPSPLPLQQISARTEDGVALGLFECEPRQPHAGARTAYLLVHGFVQNRHTFSAGELPRELIAAGGRVFLGELRGHGRSARGKATGLEVHLSLDLPALVRATQQASGLDRVVLVGHSMSGMLGYGYLGRTPALSGLVTLGSPVVLGAGRPLLRRVGKLLAPLAKQKLLEDLPFAQVLYLASFLSTLPPRRGPLKELRELARLANPAEVDRSAVQRVLRSGDPASRQVVEDLLEIIRSERAQIGGVDLVESVERSPLPILAVVGGRDIFASAESVAPILRGPGPRRILELPEAAHVDLTMGKRARTIAEAIASANP